MAVDREGSSSRWSTVRRSVEVTNAFREVVVVREVPVSSEVLVSSSDPPEPLSRPKLHQQTSNIPGMPSRLHTPSSGRKPSTPFYEPPGHTHAPFACNSPGPRSPPATPTSGKPGRADGSPRVAPSSHAKQMCSQVPSFSTALATQRPHPALASAQNLKRRSFPTKRTTSRLRGRSWWRPAPHRRATLRSRAPRCLAPLVSRIAHLPPTQPATAVALPPPTEAGNLPTELRSSLTRPRATCRRVAHGGGPQSAPPPTRAQIPTTAPATPPAVPRSAPPRQPCRACRRCKARARCRWVYTTPPPSPLPQRRALPRAVPTPRQPRRAALAAQAVTRRRLASTLRPSLWPLASAAAAAAVSSL